MCNFMRKRLTTAARLVQSMCAVPDASGAGRENPIDRKAHQAPSGRFFVARCTMVAGMGKASALPVPFCRIFAPISAAAITRREKRNGGSTKRKEPT